MAAKIAINNKGTAFTLSGFSFPEGQSSIEGIISVSLYDPDYDEYIVQASTNQAIIQNSFDYDMNLSVGKWKITVETELDDEVYDTYTKTSSTPSSVVISSYHDGVGTVKINEKKGWSMWDYSTNGKLDSTYTKLTEVPVDEDPEITVIFVSDCFIDQIEDFTAEYEAYDSTVQKYSFKIDLDDDGGIASCVYEINDDDDITIYSDATLYLPAGTSVYIKSCKFNKFHKYPVYIKKGDNDYGTLNSNNYVWIKSTTSKTTIKVIPTDYNLPKISITDTTITTLSFTVSNIDVKFQNDSAQYTIYLGDETGTVIDNKQSLSFNNNKYSTTITGLMPGKTYAIHAEFYSNDNSNWTYLASKEITLPSITLPIISVNDSDGDGVIDTALSVILDIVNKDKNLYKAEATINTSPATTKEIELPSVNNTFSKDFTGLKHNTTYIISLEYFIEEHNVPVAEDSISFTTLNAYTINTKLNNLNHIYIETEGMDDVYVTNGGTFLVIPGETFTVSFPNNAKGKSAFTNYDQTHDEGKKATYSWPYGFPVKVEGIKDKETSRIPDDPGKASYLVGTAETENGKTYTFTAYPSSWTGWTDTEKPKAGQQTTTFSVESWNKLVNCLDAWNAFCGKSAVKDTFMPQSGSYNFTATIYNKIYDELTNLFAISETAPIMPRVEIGKERQTEVSASRLINIGNNIKYANLDKDYQ